MMIGDSRMPMTRFTTTPAQPQITFRKNPGRVLCGSIASAVVTKGAWQRHTASTSGHDSCTQAGGRMPQSAERRIPSLDGLRAVSIALVLLGHLAGTAGFPITEGGGNFSE